MKLSDEGILDFWGRGFFSSTSGNITDDMINEYINQHSDAHKSDNIKNIGEVELYTIFWINEFYNPEDSDTFFENV